jgi:hypothetical protein
MLDQVSSFPFSVILSRSLIILDFFRRFEEGPKLFKQKKKNK